MKRFLSLTDAATISLLSACFALAATAQTYLEDEGTFLAAWEMLIDEIGDTDLLWLRIEPTRISAGANTRREGEFYNAWMVERVTRNTVASDVLRGPGPLDWGPNFVTTTDPFKPSDMQVENLFPLMRDAIAYLRLQAPGQVRGIDGALGRMTGHRTPVPRWSFDISNGREFGVVRARVDGRIYAADISHTMRGKNIDLLTQRDWDFGAAEAGYAEIVGKGALVHEIKVLSHGIELDAELADRPGKARIYRWNGAGFSLHGLEKPVFPTIVRQGAEPFAVAASGLARLPDILDAARAAAPQGWRQVDRVRATMPPAPSGQPEVLWTVALIDPKAGDEKVTVRVRADASVHSVALPQGLKQHGGYLTLAGMRDAFAQFDTAFGGDAPIFEILFRQDRVSVVVPDPDDPNSVAQYTLGSRGITRGMGRPRIMEDDADLIALSRAAGFHEPLITEAVNKVLGAYGVKDAEMFMLKIWSGAPFYTHPNGTPFMKMHVGVPPRHSNGGFAVFTIDGDFVEAAR